MLNEFQLRTIADELRADKEVLVMAASEEQKIKLQEQTKFFSGNLKIKTIDHKNTFKQKSDPLAWIEETAPISQEALNKI